MTKLKRLGPVVLLSALIALFAGAALATPPKDAVVTLLARGSVGELDARHGDVQVKRENGNADVATFKVAIEPGGSTGWHHHPGVVVLVSVASGSVTEYHEDCDKTVLEAGEGFSEGTDETHLVRNTGNDDAELYVTFIVPSSTSEEELRIDDPQPEGCDAE